MGPLRHRRLKHIQPIIINFGGHSLLLFKVNSGSDTLLQYYVVEEYLDFLLRKLRFLIWGQSDNHDWMADGQVTTRRSKMASPEICEDRTSPAIKSLKSSPVQID